MLQKIADFTRKMGVLDKALNLISENVEAFALPDCYTWQQSVTCVSGCTGGWNGTCTTKGTMYIYSGGLRVVSTTTGTYARSSYPYNCATNCECGYCP